MYWNVGPSFTTVSARFPKTFVTPFLIFLFLGSAFTFSASAQEEPPRQPVAYKAPLTNVVLRTLDIDKDGEISQEEIEAAPLALLSLDKNDSGDISTSELGGPGPILGFMRTMPLIRALDINGDIQFSPREIQLANYSLRKLDRDNDGKLSKADLSYEKSPDPGYEEIPRRQRMLMNQYANRVTGNIYPGEDTRVSPGYLLIQESSNFNDWQVGRHTYLLDESGRMVHAWFNERFAPSSSSAKLLPNGLLMRTVADSDWLAREQYPIGAHGILELVDWQANTLWSYKLDKPGRNVLHHDFEPLPNGNVLVTAYVGFTVEEAEQIGFDPSLANGDVVWFDSILEIKIDSESQAAKLEWQWNSWDHIIQDEFPHRPNFGVIAENPDRIDVNALDLKKVPFNNGEIHRLNSISYNAALDQILVSSAVTNEIWIIDHSTSRAEAATNEGGTSEKGGRLLYRWGNPAMIGDTEGDQSLFWQQDAKWLDDKPNTVLIYNTGLKRTAFGALDEDQEMLGIGQAYTDVIEVLLPSDGSSYDMSGTPETVWSWNGRGTEDFYSPFDGGATRLANGHTLIVQSYGKRIIELNAENEKLLDFSLPGPGQVFNIDKIDKRYSGLAELYSPSGQ